MGKKTTGVLFVLQLILTAGLLIVAIILYGNQNRLLASHLQEAQSIDLADQLRQSSDDLTHMARAYVVTGNDDYERRYWTILNIRNGKAPRPVDYHRIYWDLVTAPGEKPRPDGAPVSLMEMMQKAGFTDAEFGKLKQAQDNSNELVNTEMVAMNAVKGLYKDRSGNFTVKGTPDREFAVRLMYDDAYFQYKKSIMKPIDEFFVMVTDRTIKKVTGDHQRSNWLLHLLITVIAIILGMFLLSDFMIRKEMTTRRQAETELCAHRNNLEGLVTARTRDLKAAMDKEVNLLAEAAEAGAEKLKAMDTLQALNRQLQASDEKQRSANAQLLSSQQQLLAANQQLLSKEQALMSKIADVELFNKLMVGRELDMIELKEEVNSLLVKSNQPTKYKTV